MSITMGSASLSDNEFVAAFRRCDLPLSSFRHGDHLRFAWIVLHTHDFHTALTIIRESIRSFAEHHGLVHIYHETVTAAWVHLLASHHEVDFNFFFAMNEARLNQALLHRFWSVDLLDSPEARQTWVPPDKAPLPDRV